MLVKLTKPQRDALSQAANAMLAGEEGEGDAAGLSFAVLDHAVNALFTCLPTKRVLDADCSHAYTHDEQPADYLYCPWCGGPHHQRQ